MLAGTPPFRGENLLSISHAITDTEPESLTGPSSAVQSVVSRALQKGAASRYLTIGDLLNELCDSGPDAPTITTPTQPNVPSIAVLSFTNMSADPEQEYFCDGIAEEITNALVRVERLKVAGRTSAFSFKGKSGDLREIGRALDVSTVLEGSVRKAGNRLRITAQIVKVADGYHLWSERYDRQMEDIFEIQDEIALAVVEALKVALLGDEWKNATAS